VSFKCLSKILSVSLFACLSQFRYKANTFHCRFTDYASLSVCLSAICKEVDEMPTNDCHIYYLRDIPKLETVAKSTNKLITVCLNSCHCACSLYLRDTIYACQQSLESLRPKIKCKTHYDKVNREQLLRLQDTPPHPPLPGHSNPEL